MKKVIAALLILGAFAAAPTASADRCWKVNMGEDRTKLVCVTDNGGQPAPFNEDAWYNKKSGGHSK